MNSQSVSGSKFTVRTAVNAPTVKDRAKFHKIIPTKTLREIIQGEADRENTSEPKPSATIK